MTNEKKVNDLLRKTFDGQVTVKAGDEAGQILSAVVSTSDRDRDGEVILPEGIDYQRYRANPVLMWSHKLDIPPVGKCVEIGVDKRGLNCKFDFAPSAFGKELFSLYRGGYLRAFSISFAPLDFDRTTRTHRAIELYEISCVPLPSNPQALVQAVGKGLKISSALRKDLGLKDEITIEDSPEITIEGEAEQIPGIREDVRKILVERIKKISAQCERIRGQIAAEKKKEIIIDDLKKSDIEKDYLANVTAEQLDKAVEKALKDEVELAIAKVRGRVI